MHLSTALVAVLAVAAAVTAGAATDGRTALRITYWEDARSPETRIVRTLGCNPVRGTHPRRTAACRELGRSGVRTLLPVPPDAACTQVYGGAMVAIVQGVVGGRRVWVRLRRDNGCEIDRWERNWFLVPSSRVR